MAVRRYKAKSIQEAINRIKEDFGPDAMILSTRRMPKNAKNPYTADFFEVTAALQKPDGEPESAIHEIIDGDDDPESTAAQASGKVYPFPNRGHDDGRKWKTLQAELFSIKDMLFLIDQSGGLPDFLHHHPESLNLYAKLVKKGISERRAQAFIRQALEIPSPQGTKPEPVIKRVYQEILSSILVADPFSAGSGQQHLTAFIGPTGVGKTTTIAKLAAILSLKRKKKVGIISIDSYRVGAVEQLRTYAAIMGLPCLSAFSKVDLKKALAALKHKDSVLIDTAGQSHLDIDRMKELGRMMAGDLSISSHLVLSATTSRRDMKEAAGNFAVLNPESYVFTKLDETRRRGALIDQVSDLKLPISFITNGQRVPEDILPAKRKNIMQYILG